MADTTETTVGKPLPDRGTVEQRLQNVQNQLWDIHSMLKTAMAALTNEQAEDVNGDDIAIVLKHASRWLRDIAGNTIDPVTVLKAAEAEVSHV